MTYWRLATQLESDFLEVGRCRRFQDGSARRRRPCKGHLVPIHVVGQRVAGRLAEALQQIDGAGREPGLANQLAHLECRQRSSLG